jgi:hypothetical protein
MNVKRTVLAGLIALSLLLPSAALAAAVKTYQVTGPVLEVTADKIVVKKGNDRWEIARDSATKVMGDLQVGEKVTIEYTMTATKVEVKGEKAAGAKAATKKGKK